VANPIHSDNILTHEPLKQRNSDATRGAPRQAAERDAPSGSPADDAQLSRAIQRYSQETVASAGAPVTDSAEATRRVAALKTLIEADPRQAAAAHGGIDTDAYEAAIARPTV